MSAVAPLTDYYVDAFNEVREQLPGSGVAWLQRLREAALDHFKTAGFPSTRDEDWKYTNLRSLQKQSFQLPAPSCVGLIEEDLGEALMGDLEAHRLVFVNGRYTAQLSKPGKLPRGVKLGSLAQAIVEVPTELEPFLGHYADSTANGFAALNSALMRDGAYIHLAKNTVLDKPIHLIYLATAQAEPSAYHLRNLVIADEGAQAAIIENYISMGDATYLNNVITELAIADNATMDHYKLQQESPKGYHVATLQAHQGRDSRFVSHSMSIGGALVRNDVNSVLDAEGASCQLNGLYVVTGRQHVDFHTRIDHKKPYGVSREFYKGVIGGRGRAVFNGKVYVHPHALKTDAAQSNKNLLLSRDAEVDAKPQLEIYADDVKCSHGATVGQLDEQMMFYLRSRGIEENLARGMLTYGFAHDIIERMGIEPIRKHMEQLLTTKLPYGEFVKALA